MRYPEKFSENFSDIQHTNHLLNRCREENKTNDNKKIKMKWDITNASKENVSNVLIFARFCVIFRIKFDLSVFNFILKLNLKTL